LSLRRRGKGSVDNEMEMEIEIGNPIVVLPHPQNKDFYSFFAD